MVRLRMALMLAVLCLFGTRAEAQVSIENQVHAGAVSSSETMSLVITSANALVVTCSTNNITTNPSATWNGGAITLTASDVDVGVFGLRTAVLTLLTPTTGTHNVVVTFGGSEEHRCTAAGLLGVSSVGTPQTSHYTGAISSDSLSTTVSANGLVVDAFTVDASATSLATNAGQTNIDGPGVDGSHAYVVSTKGGPNPTTGETWAGGGGFYRFSHVVVPFNPTAAGGPAVGSLGLLGVGK